MNKPIFKTTKTAKDLALELSLIETEENKEIINETKKRLIRQEKMLNNLVTQLQSVYSDTDMIILLTSAGFTKNELYDKFQFPQHLILDIVE